MIRFLFLAFVFSSVGTFQHASALLEKIYEAEDLSPAPEDPWKKRLSKTLSPQFIQRLYDRNKESYPSEKEVHSAISMTDSEGKVKESKSLQPMGNFVFHKALAIGSGEEGTVYLAQHIPTGVYAAVKEISVGSNQKVTTFPEYRALKDLKRLYACYLHKHKVEKRGTLYLYMPLVIGETINSYYCWDEESVKEKLGVEINEKKEVTYKNWPLNLHLMRTFIEEYKYTGGKGAFTDGMVLNVLHTEEDHQVVFVDMHPAPKPFYSPKEIKLQESLVWFQYFLGLVPFRKGHGLELEEDILFPPPVKKFNNFIIKATEKKSTLYAVKEKFLELEEDMKKYMSEK